ncbi:hypothetical protein JCM13304A_00160 [Desulfothermus okinawensis JCM 13304]
MLKKVCFHLIGLLIIGFLMVGCAKKKITSYPQANTQETKNTTLTQEDLTKKTTNNMKAGVTQNGKIDEYTVNSQELNSENVTSTSKKIVLPENDKKELKRMIHFAFDSYELNSEAKDILKKKAEVLLKYPSIKLIIEGHCDERGTEEYNLALGERRARAAYEYLILLGIEADRLSIVSYGEERPLDPRHNEEAWAKNRRDEFKIIY